MERDSEINHGTKSFDVLGYTCEFGGSVTADDIAFHLGTTVDAIRVQISRLRKKGLVQAGSPYRATSKGKDIYESALAEAGIDV
jgi:predicted ArsR family transcriptional regulator